MIRLLLAALLLAAPVQAQDPAKRGQVLFLQCRSCHAVAAGEAHKVGPNLHGLFGAKAASRPGFAYSPALSASGIVWSPQTLDRYLESPAKMVKGTRMAFAGVSRPEDRAAIIAWLQTATD